MQRFTTQAIVLNRTDFGEADRIISFLTPERGKIKAIAKGVRKSRSKLAGALEIFCVSQILVLPGKNEISTVMSAKLERHYGNILKNLQRTNTAYESMRLIDKITHEHPEKAYFKLLNSVFDGLDKELEPAVCELWFKAQLLKLTGHSPNLRLDNSDKNLAAGKAYNFDFEKMRFNPVIQSKYNTDNIKFLRLAFAAATPEIIAKVTAAEKHTAKTQSLLDAMLTAHLQI